MATAGQNLVSPERTVLQNDDGSKEWNGKYFIVQKYKGKNNAYITNTVATKAASNRAKYEHLYD